MQVQKEGKIGAVMTVEEGGVYEGSIEKLHTLYDLGVRISTLTWNFPNELGFPNPAQEEGKPYLPDLENGLTPTGCLCRGDGAARHSDRFITLK